MFLGLYNINVYIVLIFDFTYYIMYNYTHKGDDIMNNVRLNITLPSSVNDDINRYSQELNEKKSHIITSALDMYFDYLDLKVAEKRLDEDDSVRIPFDDFFKELESDV